MASNNLYLTIVGNYRNLNFILNPLELWVLKSFEKEARPINVKNLTEKAKIELSPIKGPSYELIKSICDYYVEIGVLGKRKRNKTEILFYLNPQFILDAKILGDVYGFK